MLRHNLDVMHIEKNIFDNLIGTFLNFGKKANDDVSSRCDLVEMKIKEELHRLSLRVIELYFQLQLS